MTITTKKTPELTVEEIKSYCDCYKRIYNQDREPSIFSTEFSNTCLGYSFHSLLSDEDGNVMGGYTAIPMLYEVEGQEMLFAFGVDLMIDESLRDDVSNLLSVVKANDKVLKEAGIKCFYGFPNDNSYKVNLAFIRMKDICSLNTFILPWKVGAVKPALSIMNPFSWLFAKSLLLFSKMGRDKKLIERLIHKKRPEFEKTRYQWFNPDDYCHYKDEEMSCYWKIDSFDGTRAAFLMDVYPMSKFNFDKAVRVAYKECSKKVGVILYVGNLPFTPISMIKVPMRFAPKNFHFVAKILDKTALSKEMVCDGNNWDADLSSYDLL